MGANTARLLSFQILARMIDVRQITKSTKEGVPILKGISFTVTKGEFVGILGPSGAGKTLTMRCLNGLTRPTSGEVLFTDHEHNLVNLTHARGRELRKARRQIGVIFQGFNLVKRLSAIDNVMIGQLGRINLLRSLVYGFTDDEARQALAVLEHLNVAHLAHRPVGSLSGGEQQRVAIARAIYQQPAVMLADEPIANLDPTNARKIMQILTPLAKEMPIIGVFHQPDLVMEFCTRIIALKEGVVVRDGDSKMTRSELVDLYGAELSEIEASQRILQPA
ncbi:ATP-binding cassette domain-containing protein [Fibrisoma montanum]|uniref:ATP-binding cassette domain-containing protein n=2 Tax=Fibrisoma montanum TaxID=2305895 RepID=A0A418MAI8_9BACT|nr:ATP-binding cassette domain-containing protein [Fibrisoma montanum]